MGGPDGGHPPEVRDGESEVNIGYLKIGRSMPLTLAKCGNLGGDVECAAVVAELARRHPADTFTLIGRNTGETPTDVGLPGNVTNPWTEWAPVLRARLNAAGLNHPDLAIEEHLRCRDIFDELTLEAFTKLDGLVVWIGQHGTSNAPIPGVTKDGLTKPQDAFAYYSSYALRGINAWRDPDPLGREPVFLNADPRNYLKMRDLKWPLRHPVLTQYTFVHNLKHERYGAGAELFEDFMHAPEVFPPEHAGWHGHSSWTLSDSLGYERFGEVWKSIVRNVYARLEVNGLAPGTPFGDLVSYDETWEGRRHFGMFINEARRQVAPAVQRITALRDWVLPVEPAWLHGTWSPASLKVLDMEIKPAPWDRYYPLLHSVRCTFTTPSSGSGWATAKPWEAFAAGTVCFFHPAYDTQDNVLGDADPMLRRFLRVSSPLELRARVSNLQHDRPAWEWLVRAQRRHFERAIAERRYLGMIEERLYGSR